MKATRKCLLSGLLAFSLLSILGATFADTAYSQTVLSGFASKHSRPGFNDQNTGLGLRIDEGTFAGWAIGGYENSIRKDSVYLAHEWQWQVAGPLHVGVLAGAVTGYQWAVTPLVLPEAVLHIDRAELALLVQPFDVSNKLPAFVSVQLRWRF